MCYKHWKQVPIAMKVKVWAMYRVGQEIDKEPSEEYLHAAKTAISAVVQKENLNDNL